jgi:hypothetical protein
MQNLAGKVVCITEVHKIYRNHRYRIASSNWYWTDEMFKDKDMEVQGMNKRVVIDTHENYVIARCGDKEGIARCHPDDDFDFYTGAKIALERLEEAEKPYGWLKRGMRYYIAKPTYSDYYDSREYHNNVDDDRYKQRKLVFQTKEEAIACARKMLAAVKQE